jgi:hypothetical protein
MRERFRPIDTNLTPVNVIGVPGLMLVLIAIALAWQFPEAQWLIAAGLAGGAVIATLLIRKRRDGASHGGDDPWRGVLGVAHDDTDRLGALESHRARSDRDPRRDPVPRRLDSVRVLTCAAGRA